MTDAKHSPAPWTWEEGDSCILDANGEDVLSAPFGDFQGSEWTGSWREYYTSVADMNLGAAAPDLLAACKFYLHQYDSSHHGEDKGETPRRIRAAIAKAEGKGEGQ